MSWETPIHPPDRFGFGQPIRFTPGASLWLELFFDLILVAAVAQVGVPLNAFRPGRSIAQNWCGLEVIRTLVPVGCRSRMLGGWVVIPREGEVVDFA